MTRRSRRTLLEHEKREDGAQEELCPRARVRAYGVTPRQGCALIRRTRVLCNQGTTFVLIFPITLKRLVSPTTWIVAPVAGSICSILNKFVLNGLPVMV
jgi:hypothetical protein